MDKTQSIFITDISSEIGSLIHVPPSIVTAVAVACLFAWTCWRTRSTHLLLKKISNIFYGKVALEDEALSRFVTSRDGLVYFRMLSGIPARTINKAGELIRWSEDNDEDISSVKACGLYFDLEQCRLKVEHIPHKWSLFIAVFFVGVMAFTSLFALWGATTSDAILKVNESGIWFHVSDKRALVFFKNSAIIPQQCSSPDGRTAIRSFGFSETDANTLCALLNPDADTHDFIINTISDQRIVFSVISITILYFGWLLLIFIRTTSNALSMSERLAKRQNAIGLNQMEKQPDHPVLSEQISS